MNDASNPAGSIHLALHLDDGRVADVDLRLRRPAAAGAMRGRTADEAVRLLPLLYSVCGAAQAVAARLAVAAARGEELAAGVDAAVLAEARREHLWRLLLDWPDLLGLPREEVLLAEARRQLAAGTFEAWCESALRAPLARLDAALDSLTDAVMPARLLPALTAGQTLALTPRLGEAFAAAPSYQGGAAETGALARYPALAVAASPAARVRARMADLFADAGLGRVSAVTVAAGIGRAAVETARGMLLHEVVLDGDRVAGYTVVAPTEWNFRPRGVLATSLEGLSAESPESLRGEVERRVLALDPCVRCDIDLV